MALGTLYIVSTPIGTADDISARALRVLAGADVVVCEELREGERLLKRYGLQKALVDLNEHNEQARTPELVAELQAGKTLALISDGGTPLFYDPGRLLVSEAYRIGAKVTAVPGASALMAALVLSALPIDQFHVAGMLPVKRDERREALRALQSEKVTCVLLDAPYRLSAVLNDMLDVFGGERPVVVACDLTMPGEFVARGNLGDVVARFRQRPFKGEYVIVIGGVS